MSRFPLALALLSLVVAGCADGPAKPAATASSLTTAAPPTVDEETGSVTGTVTDDEARPIPGATAGLIKTTFTSSTDSAGVYTLNSIPPGTYNLYVQALGFNAVGRKIDVVAGQITYANFSLIPIDTSTNASYYLPILRTAFINADQTFITFVAHDLLSQNTSTVCGSCFFDLVVPKGPVMQYMTEHSYAQTGVPGYNDGVHLSVQSDGAYDNGEYCWREQRNWNNATIGAGVAKTGKAHVAIQSSFAGISVQHRVDSWATIAYSEVLPEGYSALPPTNEKRQDPSLCIIK